MKILLIFICILICIIVWKKQIDYENYINEPYITVYARCGLCNKLRVLLSYLYRANKEGKKLRLYWIKNDECPDDFEQLFKPIKNVEIINIDDNNNYDFNTYEPDTNDFKKHKYFNLLKPLDSIQNKINNTINILNNNYIACHIRRTDALAYIGYAKNIKSDDEYIKFIDSYPNDYKIYIATDCKDTQEKFIDIYGNRMYYKKIEKTNALRQTSLEDAVIDIYVCANAKYFMESYSSFSETIIELRKY